jgi:beta-N-acetylhexosaminidase
VLADDERDFFARHRPLGFILFARNVESPEQVAALTRSLRESVGRVEAPVLVDQEGGRVQRLRPPHWRSYPPAAALGRMAGPSPAGAIAATRDSARFMADELRPLGIDVDCAPVLDVPAPGSHGVIGDRAFGRDPELVAVLGRAFAEGLAAGGVLPVVKHIPGHGRAASDSHHHLPRVSASRAELAATDWAPFRALADVPWAMTAHVVYEAIDDRPATASRRVVGDVIRGAIGFQGVLLCDDLSMNALSGSLEERARAAREAGCDIMLHCNGDMAEMAAVVRGAGAIGEATAARLAVGEAWRRERSCST